MNHIENKIFGIALAILLSFPFLSCEKYLEAKSDAKLTTISKLEDLQLLLDNYSNVSNNYPYTLEVLSDNYYLNSNEWTALSNVSDRNQYTWQRDDVDSRAYQAAYTTIARCNVVLDNISEIPISAAEVENANAIKGSALFFRAAYFYGLTQLFCKPYNVSSANSDLGIALRLASDYNEPSTRSTLQETYNRILNDLKQAASFLPKTATLKTRPTKAAAYGWLARAYLQMKDYGNAGLFADSCLKEYSALLDYNELDSLASAPIKRFNKEVILQLRSPTTEPLANARAKVDTVLFRSYAKYDLRRGMFFRRNNTNGTYSFKGDYDGSGTATGYVFAGIITDEMYLTRAESFARQNNAEAALNDLNTLLVKRWKTAMYVPFQGLNAQDALRVIIEERRKELISRGIRWTDLRRLMDDPQLAITPKRLINSQVYSLTPNSPGYVLLIPKVVIDKSGMPQNP